MKRIDAFLTLCILLIIFFFGSSCSRNEGSLKSEVNAEFVDVYESAPPPSRVNGSPMDAYNPKQETYNPKLIKKGELAISSDSIEVTKSILYGFVKACNGNISNENLVKSGNTVFYEIGLNVQASEFDKFLKMVDSSGMNIVSRSFSVEDITLQYIDDSTRLQNKKKLEKKYLDLLSRVNDMKSILEIESKIEEIRTDIESKERQLKYLDTKVAYSDFNVRIEMDKVNLTFDERNEFTYRIGHGIINGWQGMKEFLIFLVTIWPVYIFAAGIIYLIRFLIRRRRKNKK